MAMRNPRANDCEGEHPLAKWQPAKVLKRLEQLESQVQELQRQLEVMQSLLPCPASDAKILRIDPPEDALVLLASLTPRELEVLRLFAEVRACKKIAGVLGTEAQTVRNQLASIRTKLGVTTREELWEHAVRLQPWLNYG